MKYQEEYVTKSFKSYGLAVALSGVFGVMGIHHFYVERYWMGFLDFGLFLATILLFISNNPIPAIAIAIIDIIHTVIVTYWLLTGQYKDGYGKTIIYPGQVL